MINPNLATRLASICALVCCVSSSASAENGCNGRSFAALSLPDGDIVFGGDFTECAGAAFNHVVRYSPKRGAWFALGERGRGVDNVVYSLAWYQNSVVVGGAFTRAGGKTAQRVARWTPSNNQWRSFSSADGSNGTGENGGAVITLFASNNTLYAGGQFSQMTNVATPAKAALFDGVQWSAIPSGLGPVGTIYGLLPHAGQLFVAGSGLSQVNQIARFDGAAWQPLSNGLDAPVLRLAVYQNTVVAAGLFNRTCANAPGSPAGCAGSSSVLVGNTVQWDGSQLKPINPILGGSGLQGSLIASGASGLYAGSNALFIGGLITGAASTAGSTSFYGLASTSNLSSSWATPGSIANGGLFVRCAKNSVRGGYAPAITETSEGLFVAGDFFSVGGPLSDPLDPNTACPSGATGGIFARNMAQLTPSGWQPLTGGADDEFIFGDGLDE